MLGDERNGSGEGLPCYHVHMKSSFLLSLALGVLLCWQPVFAISDVDTDADGLMDIEEQTIYFTDEFNADTDGDGYLDGVEIQHGYSPHEGGSKRLRDTDQDGDGLWDDWELALGTSLIEEDSDSDGYTDGLEVMNSFDPRDPKPHGVEKRIDVTLATQRAVYFFDDVELDGFLISSGLPRTPTPTGLFTVLKKRPTVWYAGPGYNYPDTKWNLMFKHGASGLNYYIHGAYWHNAFGSVKSGGCVNVPYEYAYMGRLYDWAEEGTQIIIQ